MKKDLLRGLLAFVFVLVCTAAGNAQDKNFIDQPYLETNAVVDTLVTPDRIYLGIEILESDTKGRTSVEKLEHRMITELRKLGIPTNEQLTLSDLSSDFQRYFLRGTEIEKRKAYTLLVYDGLMAGRVIKALERIGIANVHLQRTELSTLEDLKLQLRSQAVARAKAQAEALLQPLGQELGNALFISDLNTEYIQQPYPMMARMESAKDTYEPADVPFTKTKVEGRVNVKFAIR